MKSREDLVRKSREDMGSPVKSWEREQAFARV